MPAPVLDKVAFASECHQALEECDGRFYATEEGAERLTRWIRNQGFPQLSVFVDENQRFRIAESSAARAPARHFCHWPECPVEVPPAMWGCKPHWFRLPMALRSRIWRAYRPGQEIDKSPSREYLEVAREVQDWIAAHPEKRVHTRRV